MTVRNLVDEAAKLTFEERWELMDELLRMNNDECPDTELTPAQAADLDRRIEEVRAGKAKLIPGDEAFAMLRNRK